MTQFVKITKDDSELMHYGVLGMKWGKHRAMNAAKGAGRATSEAAGADKESKKVAAGFNRTAKSSERGAKKLSKEGKVLRSVASKTYADANRKKAKEIIEEGQGWVDHYTKVSARKTTKAYKLAEKYGDEGTKKLVDNLIKEHANKTAKGWDLMFDSTDPVASAIQDAADTARYARRRQQSGY